MVEPTTGGVDEDRAGALVLGAQGGLPVDDPGQGVGGGHGGQVRHVGTAQPARVWGRHGGWRVGQPRLAGKPVS